MQTPFTHVPPHAWLHPPQCWTLVPTSTHAAGVPHIIKPAPQAQAPPLQVAPGGQGVQPPQCSAVPAVGETQAPSVHWISPVRQLPQAPFEHPWSAPQTTSQPPQCAAFDATHWPPQASKPPVQRHCPPAHVCPIAHACPHAPQFCGSEATLAHAPKHCI
jgi:hypothetical protein